MENGNGRFQFWLRLLHSLHTNVLRKHSNASLLCKAVDRIVRLTGLSSLGRGANQKIKKKVTRNHFTNFPKNSDGNSQILLWYMLLHGQHSDQM